MYNYDYLNQILKEKGISRTQLGKDTGLSSRTIAKIRKGEKLSAGTLQKIGEYLECDASSLYRKVSDNLIHQTLRDEKEMKISGGLYHELQVRMTYNSNHMEGSQLSEEQTRFIFETNTIGAENGVSVDDVLETVHHFQAIDKVIDQAEDPLSEDMIKKLHWILKHDTKDSRLDWFAVGDYKKRENVVGGHETVKPAQVHERMNELLEQYNHLSNVSFEDIVSFHASFEYIHPFQDGNGRVGRLIALKECLHHDIIPFIIEDSKKMFYYRGLSRWPHEKGWLTDTCLDGQDTFKALLDQLGIPYSV